MKLVECVPNFSEGRDKKILDAIAAAITSVKNITMLDVDPGADTNRTVVTFVGPPEAAVEAAFRGIAKAAELIDMSKHSGAHARHGATDVCPFVPVSEMTMDECVELARKLGRRVGDELGIPVYLYEHAASKPEWSNLAVVRKGEYEALPAKMKDPQWKPDFGPQVFNAKSGVVTIGAREFLIAYNINLNTRDKKKAHDIALSIRESGRFERDSKGKVKRDANGEKLRVQGLFTNCKAVGWFIDEYMRAQISMNLTNFKITPPHIVLEKVRDLAAQSGIQVTGSELVGLIPKEAMILAATYYLERLGESCGLPERMLMETTIQSMGLNDLGPFDLDEKIIEYAIARKDALVAMKINDFADELSTDSPAPGGGSVAALCAALSGGLSAMVGNLTAGKKGYEGVDAEVKQIAVEGQGIKDRALAAIDSDTDAFYEMMDAARLPKKTEADKAARNAAIQQSTKNAILAPLETLQIAWEGVQLAERIAAVGNANALSDAGVAAINACAAAKGAHLNIQINMSGVDDEAWKRDISAKADGLLKQTEDVAVAVEHTVRQKIAAQA
ncbi:MAG: glutamate formimidoyltransferase [Candidatus Cloacimonetes bacterium]|nr:glutamate formimidoyltransferase [Candidatus Cloacimonadota bacterium]